MEKIQIPFKDKIAVLLVQPFDEEINTEELVQIDYSNILGEIITFPVVFNRIANLKAEANNLLGQTKLATDIFEASLYDEHRKKMSIGVDKKPTGKDIEAAVTLDPRYKAKKTEFIKVQKYFDYCDALYWSAQSKDTKLNKLMERVSPKEFENDILEGTINSIQIKMVRKSIKDVK